MNNTKHIGYKLKINEIMHENISFLLGMLSYHIKFLHECALFSRLVQLFLTFSGRDQIHIITAFKLLYLVSRLVVLIQVHINCTNELVLRTKYHNS